jgi:HD-like signal output (HDOD) protein
MKESLLKNLQSIPPLPESVLEVERVYRDIDATFLDMQYAVEKDPFLVANILRIANSPFYALKTKVTSLHKAISLLGKSAIRTFVLSSTIDANFEIDLSPYGITQEEFRGSCEAQMALAIFWLSKSHQESLSFVPVAAFLGEIGRLVIAKTLFDEREDQNFLNALAEGLDVTELELRFFGASSSEITALLFEQWGLDPELVELIRYSEDPFKSAQESRVMSAELKAIRQSILLSGTITEESIAIAKETIATFGLDMRSYEAALEKIRNI